MVTTDSWFAEQAQIFSVLSSELRLRLLSEMVDRQVTAPELAEKTEFEVTAETIHNNLKQLREIGLVSSEKVYGPGNRPKDAFELTDGGFEIVLTVSDEYLFSCDVINSE